MQKMGGDFDVDERGQVFERSENGQCWGKCVKSSAGREDASQMRLARPRNGGYVGGKGLSVRPRAMIGFPAVQRRCEKKMGVNQIAGQGKCGCNLSISKHRSPGLFHPRRGGGVSLKERYLGP